jgi:DMSO/TMAO reductase YedYZ molybdopterin-dependent catalytic subunit
MDKDVSDIARKRSGYAGAAGVAVALGFTELFAGLFSSVPSAISSIGSVVVDVSPGWLESFAISAFGTQDKAVLAIGIFVTALLIGYFLGKWSAKDPTPLVVGYLIFGLIGIYTQADQPGAVLAAAAASTLVSLGFGITVFYGLKMWWTPTTRDVTDDDPGDIGRRRILVGIAGAATVTVLTIGIGRAMLRSKAESQRSALDLPVPVESAPDPTAAHDFGLPGVPPVVVGNSTFYRIDSALVVPAVDPEEWTLTIKGMVDKEVVLTYRDLQDMDLVERYVTLSCVSNEVGDNLVGNALWTGVMLRDVLDMAGVQAGAGQIVGRSVDGWTSGFPTELAYDGRDAMIAIGMNREVLPSDHGFPARIVVPGLYGYVSATKWITEIELTTWDAFDGYWIPRGWAKEGPIKTQSRIDRPRNNDRVEAGPYTLGGVAWAPTRQITRVELQVDDEPWIDAELAESLSADAWRLWQAQVDLSPGDHLVRVRATDGTGETQTEIEVEPRPDGATGWHTIGVTAT